MLFGAAAPTRSAIRRALRVVEQERDLDHGYAFALSHQYEGALGLCRIERDLLRPDRAEIGFCVHHAWRGRGYATWAVAALLARARDEYAISQVQARCALDNRASLRVLEKRGFVDVARRVGATSADAAVSNLVLRLPARTLFVGEDEVAATGEVQD